MLTSQFLRKKDGLIQHIIQMSMRQTSLIRVQLKALNDITDMPMIIISSVVKQLNIMTL